MTEHTLLIFPHALMSRPRFAALPSTAGITKGPSGITTASPAVFEFSTQSGNAAGGQ